MLSVIPIPIKVTKRSGIHGVPVPTGEVEQIRHYHLVAVDDLKRPLALGGLGTRFLTAMNKALQAKWLWNFMSVAKANGER